MDKLVALKTPSLIAPNLLSNFECPICNELFYGTVQICVKGHSVCESCIKQLERCPMCGMFYKGGRNYSLEQLLRYMKLPCMYNHNGCTKYLATVNFKDHVKVCAYRDRKCFAAFDQNEDCQWTGTIGNMVKHFQNDQRISHRK
ncbi:E3 ubiquitin-protein ligase siah-1-like [Ctenocephalides felis]|uniref:E3 ubiquitin-protein ligase siah-1-like n=1 Tax=Ctenocephalides felis TaxID=7515 RepID=UPI000E6E28D4|nr:E3 ubiquitin-protein ligase siah-1-like [Ctenocephalides felis]